VQIDAGVDTHKDTLAVAVLNDRGQPAQVCQLPNTAKGFAQLTRLLSSHDVDRVGIEGSGR
jgi:transposase